MRAETLIATHVNTDFDWSPDGKTVAFTRRFDLYRIGTDGRGLKRLFAGRTPSLKCGRG